VKILHQPQRLNELAFTAIGPPGAGADAGAAPAMPSSARDRLIEGAGLLFEERQIMLRIALDWNAAIARGGFCFSDIPCIEGHILYLALEDNKRRLKSRLTKLLGTGGEWPESFEYSTEWPTANEGGIDAIRTW
jgi:hypothetical protein